MNYQQIKSFINTYIVQNGVNAITGAQLNTILNELADYKGFDSVVVTTLPAGSDATATVQGMTLVLGIPKGADGRDGQNAVNPFKGWFTTDNIPTTGQAGDYCNVSNTSVTPHTVTIYRWSTANNRFEDTGEVPDTATGDTFASSETLQQVAIDDSHLVNPTNTADDTKPVLARAEDVMQLKAKLEGVTASETKVSLISSDEGQNVYDGYINGSTGEYTQSNYNKFIVVPLNGAKSVRWLAKENASNPYRIGWAFGTFSGEIDETLSTFTALSKGVYGNNTLDNQAVEYIQDAPDNATHVVITIWIYKSEGDSAVTMDNFYCYLQSGESVVDFERRIDKEIYGEYIEIPYNVNADACFYNEPFSGEYDGNSYDNISFLPVSNSDSRTKSIGRTATQNYIIEGYDRIIVRANDYYDTYVTFTISSLANLNTALNLEQLLSQGILSPIHRDTAAFVVEAGTSKEFEIPSNTVNILFTGRNLGQQDCPNVSPYRVPISIQLGKSAEIGILNDIKKINKEIAEINKEAEESYEYVKVDTRHYPLSSYYISAHGNVSDEGDFFSVQIPLFEAKSVKIKSCGEARFNFLTDTLDTRVVRPAQGYTKNYKTQVADTIEEYAVPEDAKYLYLYSGSISRTMYSKTGYIPEYIELLLKKYTSNSKTVGFEVGTIGLDGFVHNDSKRAVSGFIDCNNGFYLKLNDEYEVYSASLYDMTGKLVSFNYLPETDYYFSYAFWLQDYSFYSIAYCIPYQVRVVCRRRDGGDIEHLENIAKSFVYLNDSRLHLETPDFGMQYYSNFRNRIRQLSACIFNPQAYMPTAITSSSVDGHLLKDMNRQYFRKNQLRAGVGYSSNYQYSKAVGTEVALRTYLTAIADKYGLVYTEDINKNKSDYGITYASRDRTSAVNYYGIVCSSLVGYALNMKMLYRADYWKDAKVPNTQIVNVNGQTVKVGDIIWSTGHVAIISEIYSDAQGNRKFIVWSEQTKPSPYICAITPEEFDNRLLHYNYGQQNSKIQVMRFSNWQQVDTPYNFIEDAEIGLGDFFTQNKICEPLTDIQSFAGDYAVFTKGTQIFFTVNISKGYTQMRIFDSNGDLYGQPIDITELAPNTYYNGYTDFAKLGVSSDDLDAGIYTARLSNNDGTLLSEATHFEIIYISLNVEKNGSIYECEFSYSNNASPYLLRRERENGHNVEANEINAPYLLLEGNETSANVNWEINSTYKYIKLFCKGQYGVAVVKFNAYNL